MPKRPDTGLTGVLCIRKPQEFTSFDVVAKLRGISGTRKIGHSGTLDPMATGVLPLLFGQAAKACDLLPVTDKRYRASARFGFTSDTQDIWGKVLTEDPAPLSRAALEAVLPRFRGEIMQIPPMYSAVQVGGQRLYDLARKGIEVERKPRPAVILELNLLSYDEARREAVFDILCSKGTYIRTLCHDIGAALGMGAVMTGLTRTEAAGFTLADCVTIEEAQQAAAEGRFPGLLQPVSRLFAGLPAITLSEGQARLFRNGARLDLNRIRCAKIGGDHAVYGPGEEFLGIAVCDMGQNELVIRRLFAAPAPGQAK